MTTPFIVVEKDVNAVLDYRFDWSDWLQTGETISTSSWTTASGITLSTASATTTTATMWLSSGVNGVSYDLVNRIITSSGRTDDRTIRIEVTER